MSELRRTEFKRKPSKRKQAFDAEYAALLPGVLKRGCEFRDYTAIIFDYPEPAWAPTGWRICDGRRVGHHAKGRRVADANDHLICLCDKHHKMVHDHPQWAREVRLMLTRTV